MDGNELGNKSWLLTQPTKSDDDDDDDDDNDDDDDDEEEDDDYTQIQQRTGDRWKCDSVNTVFMCNSLVTTLNYL